MQPVIAIATTMFRNGSSCHTVLIKHTLKEEMPHTKEMGPQQESLLGQYLKQLLGSDTSLLIYESQKSWHMLPHVISNLQMLL